MSIVVQCRNCRQPLNRPEARFCNQCGATQAFALDPLGLPLPTAPATVISSATLEIIDEAQTRTVHLLNRVPTFGRAPDIKIVASRFVSGHHTRFEPEGSAHRIVDVGTRNALLFEGRRILPSVRCATAMCCGSATRRRTSSSR